MIAVDSSVIVTAAVGERARRDDAKAALADQPRLPSHAAFESYAVLTRLPPPLRMSAADARSFIRSGCSGDPLLLSARALSALLADLPALSVVGGSVYDALIGRTAAVAGARLLTLDRRAYRTYLLVGADVELVGEC